MADTKQIERALFDTARKIEDTEAREAFLEQACNGCTELRARLDKLLAVSESAEEFFSVKPGRINGDRPKPDTSNGSSPALAEMANGLADMTNATIGRYKLLQRLGEGGCGVVYQAEQIRPMRRNVALKIIRLGMDTESVIGRFEAERQALALMDHPNIAQVLDAGATETGRPYFVMELVHGVKITDYCDQNHLDIPQRLNLFIQICHAIQHAHQKGVIHRDIKPSNILVTMHDGLPVPKVIDFGIAKATEGKLTENLLDTNREQLIGTPAYMSPEQADKSGLDVDTRSDIYSLGVLLYELLTGRTPFDSKRLIEAGVDAMRTTLREREPQPPSTLLTTLGNTELTQVAASHNVDPQRFIPALRGDLDWIVMKALEKDRRRRYETANGLAMDVQRYLSNEPVMARPPSGLYRLQKLVRRNKITFLAIGGVTVALLLGLSVSTILFFEEREAHREAVAAEQQQFHLRQESDRLRQEAEFRQKLTAATFARSRDQMEEADQLVADVPAPQPNLEYADLFRTLGDWHAGNDRWKQAMERCSVLMQVNLPDDWDVTTLDYLRYGPLLLETGDLAGYEKFRQSAVAHFTGTVNPVAAERVVKVSLLTPASADLMAPLSTLANTAANSLADPATLDTWQKSLSAWRALSLALMEYRRGNYPGVEHWHDRAMEYQSNDFVRNLTFQVVLGSSHLRAGQVEQGRSELESAQQKIETHFQQVPVPSADGYWFDWVFARILLREVTSPINGTPDQIPHQIPVNVEPKNQSSTTDEHGLTRIEKASD